MSATRCSCIGVLLSATEWLRIVPDPFCKFHQPGEQVTNEEQPLEHRSVTVNLTATGNEPAPEPNPEPDNNSNNEQENQ